MCRKDSYTNIFHNGTILQCLPYLLRLISSLGNLGQFCCSSGQSGWEGSKQQLHSQLLPSAWLQPGVFYGIPHIRLYISPHPFHMSHFLLQNIKSTLLYVCCHCNRKFMPTKQQLNSPHSTASNTSTKMVENRPTIDCYPLLMTRRNTNREALLEMCSLCMVQLNRPNLQIQPRFSLFLK